MQAPYNRHRNNQDSNVKEKIRELVPEEDAWTVQAIGFHVESRLVPVRVDGVALECQDKTGTDEPDNTDNCSYLDEALLHDGEKCVVKPENAELCGRDHGRENEF